MVEAPLAGVDYPRTLAEFNAWFSDEEACLAYLERLRWPEGFCCPWCASTKAWRLARPRKLRCAGCRREVSITDMFRLPTISSLAAHWGGNALPSAVGDGLNRANARRLMRSRSGLQPTA